MLKIFDNVEIKDGEVFGLVGLVDSGRTTMLKNIYKKNKSSIRYVDELPELNFLKVKTYLCKKRDHEYVKKLDLNINKRICDLNYNETRKFLFLLSVFTDKPVIILDEPLLLVEDSTKQAMLQIISKMDKTFLISFDNLAEAKLICDQYAIIKDYKVIDVQKNKKDQNMHHVIITGDDVNKGLLPLKDMKVGKFNSKEVEFIYKGDINELLKYLVDIKIKTLEIRSVDLEDLYKYYIKK